MSSPGSVPTYTLNNGVRIPAVAHGAWAPDTEEARHNAKEWLLTALKVGYRHIDTAQDYNTEKVVSVVIKESGIPREEIFITSKLSPSNQHRVAESFEESLQALSFLIHWPQAIPKPDGHGLRKNPDGTYKIREDVTFHQAWAELEKLFQAGKIKAIGVSNFSVKTLEELAKTATITPAVNQVELHPYLAQENLREYCDKKGIVIAAYTPSGYDNVRKDPLIIKLAEKYKLPTLETEDIIKVSKLDRNQRICNAADEHGQILGWSLERMGW
ncbi:hypothetical protein C0992_008759 [Termitomyces sp. T32_za158]|nr:hypothetical protein C0992_008759 [Termitomyces sp. T32_za158]